MAEMTLLTMTQEFCRRQGLPQPSTVTGATDDGTQQIWGLLNEGLQSLADRHEWGQLLFRTNFRHAGAGTTSNTAITFSATLPDFKALVPETLWDASSRLPVQGPLSEPEWAELLTFGVAPARYSFQIRAGALRIYPTAPATTTFTMTYYSRNGAFDPVSSANVPSYVSDTTYPLLPDHIILADLKWRWRQAKGLPYAEDMRTAEEIIQNEFARQPAARLSLDNEGLSDRGPRIFIPTGTWSLP